MAGYDALVCLYPQQSALSPEQAVSLVEVLFGEPMRGPKTLEHKRVLTERLATQGPASGYSFVHLTPAPFKIILEIIPLRRPLFTADGETVKHEFALQSNINLQSQAEVDAYLGRCRSACLEMRPVFALGGHKQALQRRYSRDPRSVIWGFNYLGAEMIERVGCRNLARANAYLRDKVSSEAMILQLGPNPFDLTPELVQLAENLAAELRLEELYG